MKNDKVDYLDNNPLGRLYELDDVESRNFDLGAENLYRSGVRSRSSYRLSSEIRNSRKINKLEEDIDNIYLSIQNFKRELEESHDRARRSDGKIQKLSGDSRALEKKIHDDRYKTVEIISIVAAFFAFIATEFQLLAHLKSFWQFLSISLIAFGCTSFFALIMARVARDPGKYNGIWDFMANNKLLVFSVAAVIMGAIFPVAGYLLEKGNIESKDDYVKVRRQSCNGLANRVAQFDFNAEDAAWRYDQLRTTYDTLQCSSPDLLK